MSKLMNKLIDPIFKRKINKRLDVIRKTHIESLPEKSFAKKFQDQFRSRKDMGNEKALIRFSENKSMHNLSVIRTENKTLINPELIKSIANKNNYKLENATFIHQHPKAETKICYPNLRDLCSFGIQYLENNISKFEITYMDNYNIKEIGRSQLLIKSDNISIKKLKSEIKKYFELEYKLKDIKEDLSNIPEINEIENKKENIISKIINCFYVKQIGLNGYKYNQETKKFIK